MSIVSVNINGCESHLESLLGSLQMLEISFDILILTEIKLSIETTKFYSIPNYNHISVLRNCHGGGIRLYYRDNMNIVEIPKFSNVTDTHESLFVKVSSTELGNYIIGCFYRPPGKSLCNFNRFLDEVLFNDQEIVGAKCLFFGDFNINIDPNITHNYQTRYFCNIMRENNFNQYVCNLTRCDYLTCIPISLLDHAWANFGTEPDATVLNCLPSDHLPIHFTISSKENYQYSKMKFRNFSHHNVRNFNQNVKNIFNCYSINLEAEIDDEFERLIKFLSHILNLIFP